MNISPTKKEHQVYVYHTSLQLSYNNYNYVVHYTTSVHMVELLSPKHNIISIKQLELLEKIGQGICSYMYNYMKTLDR